MCSKEEKVLVVHHELMIMLKKAICRWIIAELFLAGRETSDFEVVHSLPQHPTIPPLPNGHRGVHLQHYSLRQNIHPTVRFAYNS